MSGDESYRFRHIASAGIVFQGGATAVDSSTIMAALVYQLTGNAIAVGAVTAILRIGWLSPQILVGYLAQQATGSLRYFAIGGYGRATCLLLLAGLLFMAPHLSTIWIITGFFLCWTAYAFVSGIVAVPYNDIVARSVASDRRSRLLAIRFFGGGVLGVGAAALADYFIDSMPFPGSYAAIVAVAAALMYLSATLFVLPGEPMRGVSPARSTDFAQYLREGLGVFRTDRRFRLFVFAQWAGALNLMAIPFYVVVAADELQFDMTHVGVLLGTQTVGALVSNAAWGWWGDHYGKRRLLQGVALIRVLPPLAILSLLLLTGNPQGSSVFTEVVVVFFILGALMPGVTIAVLGFLMEISPDDRRPAYSGYFNALTAPAYLLPLAGGAIVSTIGATALVSLAALGAVIQFIFVRSIPAMVQAPDRTAF